MRGILLIVRSVYDAGLKANQTIALHDLSQLLQTGTSRYLVVASGLDEWDAGLDKQTLSICVGMIEAGANPDTLAVSFFARTGWGQPDMVDQAVIKELRRESEVLKAQHPVE